MKYVWALVVLLILASCKNEKETLTEGHLIEGIIENPGFDKFFVSEVSALLPAPVAAMNATTKGYVGDTISSKDNGFYLANYGNKSFIYYAEAGSNIRFKTDNDHFDKELKFEADLSDENNYLNSTNKAIEDTLKSLTEKVFELDENAFLQKVDSIQKLVNSIIEKAPKNIKPLVKDFVSSNYQLEMYAFLNQYPQMKAYQSGNVNYKPSEALQKRIENIPQLKDSMVMYLPSYRQILLSKYEGSLQAEIKNQSKALEAKTTTPVYLLLNVIEKDSTLSRFKKDYLIGTFATQFDYSPENTLLKSVNDSLQKVVQTGSVKKELQEKYEVISALPVGKKAPALSGKNIKNENQVIAFNTPTLLYFYTTADANIDYEFENLSSLIEAQKDSLQVVTINFDTEKDWKFFGENFPIKSKDMHIDKRLHSSVSKDYAVTLAQMPKLVLVNAQGEITNNYAPNLDSEEFSTALNQAMGK